MKRWAIARMDDHLSDGTLTPAFAKYDCNYRLWAKSGFNWCFGQIAARDLTDIGADVDIHIFPDSVLGMTVGDIPSGVRTTLRTKLEAAGFTFSAVRNSWSIRQLLNYVAGQLQNGISVEAGDVPDKE